MLPVGWILSGSGSKHCTKPFVCFTSSILPEKIAEEMGNTQKKFGETLFSKFNTAKHLLSFVEFGENSGTGKQ